MEYISQNKQALIEQVLAKQALVDKLLKEKCTNDLYLFNKFILKAEEGNDKVALGAFHKELCNFIQDNKEKKKLALLPRGHLKSTLITAGYVTQRIIQQPDIRILIQNATSQMAVDFLGEIKKNLTQNEDLQRIFGEEGKPWIADNPLEWSADRITLNVPKLGKKGPTVTASGIDANLVSQHYDMIIMDDVVNRENTGTRDQIEKVILKYKDNLDLLEPRGELIVIGTRWNFDDLYGWIQDPRGDVAKGFKTMVKQAYQGDLWQDPIILWPEKYTPEDFQQLYKQKGSYEFSCQYMNDPISMEDAKFKRDWFKYYQVDDLRGLTLNKYLLIDPAFETKQSSDFTAMVSIGVDDENNIWILDIIREKMLPKRMIELIFALYDKYHYLGIGIEDITFGKTLQYHLNDEMNKRRRYLPIIKMKPGDRSKEARIMGLSPLYEAGKVFHCKDLRGIQYLEDELLRYPRSSHDDIIDGLAYALDIIAPVKQKKESRWRHRYLY